jgi:rhamnogalacturonyl hydrolase YesR
MGTTTASAGRDEGFVTPSLGARAQIIDSIRDLSRWLKAKDYRGYDTFDGLNARFVRPITFENKFLQMALQQGVRRFPLNVRPFLGIPRARSTKGMGFLARGFFRMYSATGKKDWLTSAENALKWLIENQSKGYSGACWGNHFDYRSRTFYLPKGVPTVVWTSLIGQAFLDGYECTAKSQYLDIAMSACEHILRDLGRYPAGEGTCIGYIPTFRTEVHNANTLGACLLARAYSYTNTSEYLELSCKAMQYTAQYQRADGSWYYGEKANLHWVDNFHTGYVLDCFKHYGESTQDDRFNQIMMRGYQYWKDTFFLSDGTPRYYDRKTLPVDIQCASQAIDTLVFFADLDTEALPLALKVAQWTIANMRDPSGYFYYRRYSQYLINKTPTLHWGQATMLCALSGLYQRMRIERV